MKKFLCCFVVCFCYGVNYDLEEIDVVGNKLNEEKKVYTKSKAISARENISEKSQSLDQIIRTIPGAFTNQDKATATISPNIRGSSGFGRINTMIDGVSQTFYSSGGDDGRNGSTSQFGAAIDPNFISGIEVERGSFSGKNGINSLMGSANLKTIGVDDIVRNGENFGFAVKGEAGNNDYKHNYATILAAKKALDSGATFGVLAGYSKREISQNYKVGGGLKITQANDDFMEKLFAQNYETEAQNFHFGKKGEELYYCYDRDKKRHIKAKQGDICGEIDYPGYGKFKIKAAPHKAEGDEKDLLAQAQKSFEAYLRKQFDIKPFDPNKLKQNIQSYIAKIEYTDDKNLLTLSFRNLENTIWQRKIKSDNYQLNYNLNSGDYLDLNFLFSYAQTKQNYKAFTPISTRDLIADLKTTNRSNTFDISNTFKSDFADEIFLTTTFGFNNFKNSYSKNRHPYELVWFNDYLGLLNGEYDSDLNAAYPNKTKKEIYEMMLSGKFFMKGPKGIFGDLLGGDYFDANDKPDEQGYRSNTFQPSGKQRFLTFYMDNGLEYDIFGLNLNTNFVKYRYSGKYFDKADKTKSYENNEFLFDDFGKRDAINFSGILKADINEFFAPFISYAKTTKFPTIQELYYTQRTTNGIRNDLKNETAKTWQIGFNSFKEDFILNNDIFGFKFVYYNTDTKNYIHTVERPRFNTHNPNKKDRDFPSIEYDNYERKFNKNGIEIEISYDAGLFYANLVYSRQKSHQPTSASDAGVASNPKPTVSEYFSYSHGISKISMLPKDYGFLDSGIRILNNSVTLGSRVKYFGESKKAYYDANDKEWINEGGQNAPEDKRKAVRKTEIIDKQPLIFDFYASYEPIKNLIIRAEIQNVFDKQYIDPLDANNDSASQRTYSIVEGDQSYITNLAKGRTAILSFSYKY